MVNSQTFLMVNTTTSPTTICRIRADVVNWFETRELESPYANIRWLAITSRLEKKRMEEKDNSMPILEDMRQAFMDG